MLRLADIKGFELAFKRGKMTLKQLRNIAQYRMENRARMYYENMMGVIA
jgi:hypothetical protein